MIAVTRLDGTEIVVNVDLIEHIEPTPDTLVSLVNGEKLLVRETPDELVARVIRFKRAIADTSTPPASAPSGDRREGEPV